MIDTKRADEWKKMYMKRMKKMYMKRMKQMYKKRMEMNR